MCASGSVHGGEHLGHVEATAGSPSLYTYRHTGFKNDSGPRHGVRRENVPNSSLGISEGGKNCSCRPTSGCCYLASMEKKRWCSSLSLTYTKGSVPPACVL